MTRHGGRSRSRPRKKSKAIADYDDDFDDLETGGEIAVGIGFSIVKDSKTLLWWIKVLALILFAGSAIGGGIYWHYVKPVIVTHFMEIRDAHHPPCFALLDANGNFADDDDSDDFCLWREHQYNITYTLYVWIFMIITTVVLFLGYFDFGERWPGHDNHLSQLANDNGEALYYLKLTYQPWIWWTVSAVLGRFEVFDLAIAAVLAVFYCFFNAMVQESNKLDEVKDGRSVSDQRSIMSSYLTPYESLVRGPIVLFLLVLYWITFCFVQYFEIFSDHIRNKEDYILFVFVWEVVFTLTEYFGEHIYYTIKRTRLLQDKSFSKRKRDVRRLKYRWACLHWLHQIAYVVGFIWVLGPLLYNENFII